jgi:NAD(P)-dependent dehydrogenase (short-subunit alcohol dehydrogenase family)
MSDLAKKLAGRVALVTGASRGVGRGAAIGLGEAGATVYVTARTLNQAGANPGTAEETAQAVTAAGGNGIALQCDHLDDAQVDAVFERIRRDHGGGLDILVNNVYPAPGILPTMGPLMTGGKPFWESPVEQGWETAFTIGVRGHYVATQKAMPMLLERSGIVVNIASPGNYVYIMSTLYGMGRAAGERMTQQMAMELAEYPVSVMMLWPGVVRTEVMGSAIEQNPEFIRETLRLVWTHIPGSKALFDRMSTQELLSLLESPTFTGRAIAALAADSKIKAKSGRVLSVPGVAKEYGFTDIDGRIPDGLGLLHEEVWPPLGAKGATAAGGVHHA